jgi:membrane associated rhomboid family serine protease
VIPIKDDIPSRSIPVVTYGLMAVSVLAFGLELQLSDAQLRQLVGVFGFSPAEFRGRMEAGFYVAAFLPAVTSMFLHAGWLHLGGNMLFLYIFGDNVEDRLGHVRFLLFYLGCGLAAAIAQAAVGFDVRIPMIGASGAIAGVLGAYFVLFPRARVLTLLPIFLIFPIVPLRATWFLGIWIAVQVVNGSAALGANASLGGVAWVAHVSGFVAGLLAIRLFAGKVGRSV